MITKILNTLPNNNHYLSRYIKFINYCIKKNKRLDNTIYTEKHHICPKAKDMFPEYADFKKFPWNCIKLTSRQHYIAHLLLWKSYPNIHGAVRGFAFFMQSNSSSRFYETYRIMLNQAISTANKGKVIVRDSLGKTSRVFTDDAHYLSGDLVSVNKGKTVFIDKEGISKSLSIKHPDVLSGKVVGHTKGVAVMKDKNNNILAVSIEDERIKTGELVGSQKGKISINNGSTNKRIYPTEVIPEGWVKGIIRPNGPKGKIWITNGVDSKMIKPEEIIPDDWLRGRTVNKIWIHNFYESKQLDKQLPIPVGWVKGMAPQ